MSKYFIFVDESGDPGVPYKLDDAGKVSKTRSGKKIPSGASKYYIVAAIPVEEQMVHQLAQDIVEIKAKYNFEGEVKSTTVPTNLYQDILSLIAAHGLTVYYRCIDKERYAGVFGGSHSAYDIGNLFDSYNTVKVVLRSLLREKIENCEVVLDRAERRAINGTNFDGFNDYLKDKINNDGIKVVHHVSHIDSQYVPMLQLADLVSGAIKDTFTQRDVSLKKIIKKNLWRVW